MTDESPAVPQPDGKEDIPGAGRRVFTAPPGTDRRELARALAEWLAAERVQETACRPLADGWLLDSRDTGSRLGRLVRRRAASFHILLTGTEGNICVDFFHGPAPAGDRRRGGANGFSLRATAARARNATAGIGDLLRESGTMDAVFDFAGRWLLEKSGHRRAPVTGRFVETLTRVEETWLAVHLDPGEQVLAWLHTATAPPGGKGTWRFLLTDRRAVLAAFSRSRFHGLQPLPPQKMQVTDGIGKDTVTAGDIHFRTLTANDGQFRQIAHLPGLEPARRLAEAARLDFLRASDDPAIAARAARTLAAAGTAGRDPWVPLETIFVGSRGGDPRSDAFDGLKDDPAAAAPLDALAASIGGRQLADWAGGWGLTTTERLLLAAAFLAREGLPPGAVAAVDHLLTDTRVAMSKADRARGLAVVADLLTARGLAAGGRTAEAISLLEKGLAALPDETLADLLPAGDTDLTRGEGGQVLRVRILERLAVLRGGESVDIETLRELAVLQPLVPQRMRALAAAARGRLQRRAATALHLLSATGPGRDAAAPCPSVRALGRDRVASMVRHPAGREGTMIDRIQRFLAAGDSPDHSALKSYARRVNDEEYPELAAALRDGTTMLGMAPVAGFISSGELNVGVRGHDGRPPFILVGSEHLDPAADRRMTPAELRFLVGAELAHIHFGHERITSREVWEGTFDKAMSLVELVPVLGGMMGKIGMVGRLAGQVASVADKVAAVQRYFGQAREVAATARRVTGRPAVETDGRQADEADLIASFRVMQLTADRAALVLGGDLAAAVGAVFKSVPALEALLPEVREQGLDRFLQRTDDGKRVVHQDLAIRLAALFSFYVSPDYGQLRAAVRAGT